MESPSIINARLREFFGLADNAEPNYRVVWSNDQFEKRSGTFDKYSDHGVWLGQETGIREVPKYKQWLPSQYVLEVLTPVPPGSEIEGPLSYEPLWAFGHLPPDWEVIKIIIDQRHERMGKKVVEMIPESEKDTPEAKLDRIEKLEKHLFEDETNIQARLHFKEAIVHPGLPSEN